MKRHLKLYLGFFISYILVLLLPIIIGSILYQRSIEIIKNYTFISNQNQLEQSKEDMNLILKDIESRFIILGFNDKIRKFYSMEPLERQPSNMYKVFQLMSDLSYLQLTSDYIDDIYIYAKKSDILFSRMRAYTDIDRFFDGALMYEYPEKRQELENIFLLEDFSNNKIIGSIISANIIGGVITDKRDVLLYIRSMPFSHKKEPDGLIMIIIKQKELENLLQLTMEQGYVFVEDKFGNPILWKSGNGEKPEFIDIKEDIKNGYYTTKINNEEMLVSQVYSEYNGWRYISVMPYSIVAAELDNIKQTIRFIAGITLFVGIVIASILALRNFKPICDITNLINDNAEKNGNKSISEYDFIRGNISKLYENNQKLFQQLKANKELIKVTQLKRVIFGEFESCEKMQLALEHLGINYVWDLGGILLIRIEGYRNFIDKQVLEELETARLILMNELNALDFVVFTTDISENLVTIIYSFEGNIKNSHGEIEYKISKMTMKLYEEYSLVVRCSGGNLYKDVYNLSKSYLEAFRVMENQPQLGKKIEWYSDLPTNSYQYFYPIDLEMGIIEQVKIGHVDRVEHYFKILVDENLTKRKLDHKSVELLINEIHGTMIKIFFDISPSHILEALTEDLELTHSSRERFQILESRFMEVTKHFNTLRELEDDNLMKEIEKFIENSYFDSNLNIALIAYELNLTETYIYQFFKNTSGMSVSTYLEKIRIEKACDFLCAGEFTINEISEKVGYNSSHSFRRAFKRLKGITPYEYRNN